jgi:hypothetical protein
LRSKLEPGRRAAEHDPALSAALDQHVQAVRIQVDAELTTRGDLVAAPAVVLLAIYAEELYREGIKAGWEPPEVWGPDDGLSLRLLACCEIASRRGGRVRR